MSAGITVFLFNWVMMKNWGEVGVAAFTAINYMLNLGVQMFVGLSDGIVPILSFNYGAGHLNRVKETLFLGFKTNEIVVHKMRSTATCISSPKASGGLTTSRTERKLLPGLPRRANWCFPSGAIFPTSLRACRSSP
ncbi:MATE family efflux transporter [Bacteroides sp. An19]|uniref:MATE family efflux transporter n=1 Tax=Bacteroides sp. An19 TaxID=1965580 RepID=UPI00112481A4|nr:MATE family efflux transporter [Bacteroides sp. An19]